MSYEPTVWKDGDLVTSAKLNKMEQGIANNINILLVEITTDEETENLVMDKTWQEIFDADYAICVEYASNAYSKGYNSIASVGFSAGEYRVVVFYDNEYIIFKAQSTDGYPVNSISGEIVK